MQSPTSATTTSGTATQKWLRRVGWVVGGVLLLWALAWLLVPPLLKSQLQKIASEELGRKVSVGTIDFKPWTLELTLNDLAVATQDGSAAQFQIQRVYLNAEIESVLRLAPVVETLVVDGPQLKLTHLGAGRYDIDDILARLARPTPDPKANNAPLRFALFNVSLLAGAVDFDDRSVNKIHVLRDVSLRVPFLSNIASRQAIKVEPRLVFNLNGSWFDSDIQATPFAPGQKTDASFRLRAMDLAPYLPYMPNAVPVRLQQAVLEADIKLAFEHLGTPVVRLSGTLELAGVKVADSASQDLLAFERLKLTLDDLRPLEQSAKLALVELDGPKLVVRRDASGRINLDLASAPQPAPGIVVAATAAASAPAAPAGSVSAVPGGWQVEVARLALKNGAASWTDAAVAPQAELLLRDLTLEASAIVWPLARPAAFEGSATVGSKSSAAGAQLRWSGSATDREASVKLALDGAPLALAAPYLAEYLEPSLRGNLSSELALNWNASDLQVTVDSLTVTDLALGGASASSKPELAAIKKISVAQTQIDLARRSVLVGRLVVEKPRLAVSRTADKRWMYERWLKPPRIAVASRAPAVEWRVVVADLALDGGNINFDDQSVAKPVLFELSGLKVQMKNVRTDANQLSRLELSARLLAPASEPGQLDYRGSLQVQPLVAQGNIAATRIPVHLFEPYFGGGLNIELLRADAGFRGDVRYAELANGPSVRISGDAVVEEFRASSLAANDAGLQIAQELLNWKALSLRGLEVALAPGSATTVAVKETTLSDFFARVIVYENGRINLQNLVKSSAPPETTSPATAVATASGATGTSDALPAAAGASAAMVPAAQVTGLEPVINIGPVSLINGKVFFSDRFVRPNYSANLSDLTGKLSAFSSVAPEGQPQLADLELRGRAEGTASLEILGKLNPLAKPLALDIKGLVRDLELPPLSPYSIKYAGHGIERGKLSLDVAYLVLPDGQLTASNKVVLNQLTFGDKVEGAPNSLPVRLAVALLADRNGVIDINLPVSGSLNDPQFSLGPVIIKVIVNLIVKAITAPFSLLASAFGGGGDELSVVAFAPGSATLSSDAKLGLDKVAKALAERPALKMTVVGTSSLEAERGGYKRARLLALMLVEKRRALVTGGSGAGAQEALAPLTVSEQEMPGLLKEVYQRADITKPRNLAGIATELPAPEMEALLLANIAATDDAMGELALQRGIAVKDYLSSQKLPVERLFLGATKPAPADPKWSPRAELSLASN